MQKKALFDYFKLFIGSLFFFLWTSFSYAQTHLVEGEFIELSPLGKNDFRVESSVGNAQYENTSVLETYRMSTPESNIRRDYLVIEKIGEGSEASVYQVMDRSSGKHYVLKQYHRVEKKIRSIDLLTFYEEKSPLLPYEYVYNIKTNSIAVLMKEATPMSEFVLLNRPHYSPVEMMYKMTMDLLPQILYLEKKGLYHGDINPNNILYDKETRSFYLSDFDKPNRKGETPLTWTDGFSPDIKRSEFSNNRLHGLEMDLHAFGKSMEFMIGYYLFENGRNKISSQEKSKLRSLMKVFESFSRSKNVDLEYYKKTKNFDQKNKSSKTYWRKIKKEFALVENLTEQEMMESIVDWARNKMGAHLGIGSCRNLFN